MNMVRSNENRFRQIMIQSGHGQAENPHRPVSTETYVYQGLLVMSDQDDQSTYRDTAHRETALRDMGQRET